MAGRPRAPVGLLAVALAAGWACACAHERPMLVTGAPADGDWVVVPNVTLYTQRGDTDCGPASLATLLSRWGVAPAGGWGAERARGSESGGATAGALRDEARRLGFQSFVFEGTFEDLDFEIAAQRPVLVGLVRNVDTRRWAHFSVVVGREAGGGRWLLANPAIGLEVVGRDVLDRQWSASGFVTLVLQPSDGREGSPAPRVHASR